MLRVSVRVPATSANLGPGFDTLGLALGVYNHVTATFAEGVSVTIVGEGAGELPTNEDNDVARGVRLAFEAAQRPFSGCALACVNRIPIARGLGSSAAAWVGGLVAGNALLGGVLDAMQILALAARAEGHPDNVAAALLGGLTVSSSAAADGGGVEAVSVPVAEGLGWVVLVPDVTGSTREARAVLPAMVPRADAVFNVQRVALLLSALQSGRPDLISLAMVDRLHEPYRERLFPWMPAVAAGAREAGALACVLSGAGPSLLAVTTNDSAAVGRAMEVALSKAGVDGVAYALAVDRTGAMCTDSAV